MARSSTANRSAEIAEKIKELVRLAQEQGYLTYGDINDALPDNLISPDEMDEIYVKLRNLDVEIVDQAEVDRIKQPEPEEDEDKTRLTDPDRAIVVAGAALHHEGSTVRPRAIGNGEKVRPLPQPIHD